ncbi:hypothetical protein HYC85_012263 [Camellia sinensis]|uniref:Essential protein Yae1 N-terminal domain-containing protein n=1 Tax=Camellia sinensis TaxID=4442 RepID=A0A7J7HBF8_CAMSI|nr:hypothetical protein HYC85_012263 [Camellia sinensis]
MEKWVPYPVPMMSRMALMIMSWINCHMMMDPYGGVLLKNTDSLSDLDREWKRRHDQFHTIGYRDGVTAGKEASAQEGFNLGFKESVLAGYNWGLVRGVTSALTLLPDGLREKLVETQEEKDKFQSLYESVHSLSTTDALKLFHDMSKRSVEQIDSNEASSNVDQSFNILQNYSWGA